MKTLSWNVLILCFALATAVLAACSGDHEQTEITDPEQQALRAQFGTGEKFFSDKGLQGILDFEDQSSPVTLLQLMAVTDPAGFAVYEAEAETIWQSVSGETVFASTVIGQIIGERPFLQVRAIEFPNIAMLIEAVNSEAFPAAMDTLFAATGDHSWVLGVTENLPFKATGSYTDPNLQNLSRGEAIALLAANAGDASGESSIAGNPGVIIDMIVSDSPDPFYMVNLIDFYEQANYADGRATDLTGKEANAIYGEAISRTLLAFNSFPELLMPVAVVLTNETVDWEQAVIVRYASRDAFLNIFALNPQADEALEHKEAGVENTLVYVSEQGDSVQPGPNAGPMYNLRYCEVLLVDIGTAAAVGEVWGTQGLNLCPQQQWEQLDAAAIAAENGVTAANMNGPRFFVVDGISNSDGLGDMGNSRLFGEIEMHRLTTVTIPLELINNRGAYQVSAVDRDNVWHFVAGRRIYELTDPEGKRYIMQSFSRIVDSELELSDLASLGERLQLPEGWSFSSRVLDAPLQLPAIDGVAEVLQDDLANTYQRVP